MIYNCANWADLPWTDVRPGVRRKPAPDAVLEVLHGIRQANHYTGVPVFQGFPWEK